LQHSKLCEAVKKTMKMNNVKPMHLLVHPADIVNAESKRRKRSTRRFQRRMETHAAENLVGKRRFNELPCVIRSRHCCFDTQRR